MTLFWLQLAWMLLVTICCWVVDCLPVMNYLGIYAECATPFGRLLINMLVVVAGLLLIELVHFSVRRLRRT